jgi:hypothetical protein
MDRLRASTSMEVEPAGWAVIKLKYGGWCATLQCTGLVSKLSHCLSAKGLSIFYISAWDSDYVLVHEEHASEALQHLTLAARSFSGERRPSRRAALASGTCECDEEPSLASASAEFQQRRVTLWGHSVGICGCDSKRLPDISIAAIRALFLSLPRHPLPFLRAFVRSCDKHGDSISLLMPLEAAEYLPDDLREQIASVSWDVASVDEGALGFDSVGIVAATAGVLDRAGVPILYLSTWNTDYVLLLSSKREAAEAALNRCMSLQSV